MSPGRATRLQAAIRGLLGALVMAVALGMAIAIGELAAARVGVDGTATNLVRAFTCSAFAVGLVVLLRRRVDRLPMAGLGMPGLRDSLRTFGLGVLVTASAAAAMLGLGDAIDWVRFGAVSWPTLLTFIAANAFIALLYEALPEELALRGYAYRSLNAGLRRWTAALWTIGLFMVVPATAGLIAGAVVGIFRDRADSPALAPGGEDPVAYLILLAVFGVALIVARVTTGSLWTCIGLHLTFLTVNRITLFGEPGRNGWSAEMTTPDAMLLIPGYLLLAAGLFLILSRLQGRRIGWRDRDPESLAGAPFVRR